MLTKSFRRLKCRYTISVSSPAVRLSAIPCTLPTIETKLYAEAKFADGSVTYGKAGESKTEQSPKAMDLFTLAWQLAANDAKLPPGLKITNGKKLYSVGGLNKAGTGKYSIGGVETEVVKYRVRRGDDAVMYFFAPSLNNIPAQIGYTDDGKTYTLKLKSVQINGQAAKP